MSDDKPVCCDFCFNFNVPLFEGGFDSTTRICAFCATRALAEISHQPVSEPTPPPERPSKEALLVSIPTPKSLIAHLDQHVIGQDIAKRRLALGVSNHFKRLVDAWDCGAPDPIIADPDLQNVRIEKSNILLISHSDLPSVPGSVIQNTRTLPLHALTEQRRNIPVSQGFGR